MSAPKQDKIPIFIRNTYDIIESCHKSHPTVCRWSDDGKSFMIKNPEVFCKEIMPQFFSRNKFTSFVRQLNFYGFKKIKKEEIRINPLANKQCRMWHFQHDTFVRGQKQNLCKMRRPRLCANLEIDKKELNSLKDEVSELKGGLTTINSQIHDLKSIFQSMLANINGYNERKTATSQLNESEAPKKRKMVRDNSSLDSKFSLRAYNSFGQVSMESNIIQDPNQESRMNLGEHSNFYDVDENDAFEKALAELGPVYTDDTGFPCSVPLRLGENSSVNCVNFNSSQIYSKLFEDEIEINPQKPSNITFATKQEVNHSVTTWPKHQQFHHPNFKLDKKDKNSKSKKRLIYPHAA